ncbi:MAG TPA: methyltransferase domain-containing protein [Micromonosporaceae bacterium]
MTTMQTDRPPDEAEVAAFVERVFGDASASITMVTAALGDRLGLFRALAELGPTTPADLARRAGIVERYAREWLSAMSAAGYVRYDPATGRFELPPAHVPVLAVDDTPVSLGAVMAWLLGVAPALDEIGEAFRTGRGVRPEAYGADLWSGIERLSAPQFVNALVPQWLPQMPPVQATLRDGADVADVGCGAGRALIELAKAYPESRYVGFDISEGQLDRARRNAEAAGVGDRIRFERVDAASGLPGQYDVIFTFDVVHDAADPPALVGAIHEALRPGGSYVCTEPNGGDGLTENLTPIGALLYGVSVLYCMSVSLAADGPGLGTLGLPEPRLAELCARAGFATVRRIPIDDPMDALYEIKP